MSLPEEVRRAQVSITCKPMGHFAKTLNLGKRVLPPAPCFTSIFWYSIVTWTFFIVFSPIDTSIHWRFQIQNEVEPLGLHHAFYQLFKVRHLHFVIKTLYGDLCLKLSSKELDFQLAI